MTERTTAPYGSWSSPISAQLLSTAEIGVGSPRIVEGAVYWQEYRPTEDGRTVVVRGDAFSSPVDVTPPGFNVRTRVHEYGGGSYCVRRDTVVFSNFADQRLYRQEAGAEPVPITPDTQARHRYADGRLTADGELLICVRERHDRDDVANELVAVPMDGGPVRIVAEGHDFYSDPRIAPDGSRLAWLTWDHPRMPWDGTELWVADLAADGALSGERLVAGGPEESIWQPSWSPSGTLHLVSDRTGWWNLYREGLGGIEALRPEEAEFGWPQWIFGGSTYGFLADGRIVCGYGRDGVQHLALLDPETGELLDLDLPYTAYAFPFVVADGSQAVFVAGSATIPSELVTIDFGSRAVEVLGSTSSVQIDPAFLSVPEPITFPSAAGRESHAHFYPPTNGDHAAPEADLPPLVVMSHGGPTSQATPMFDLGVQFFTSRGFAVVDVNYGGSTGYGREYRDRLKGNWGIVDTEDCVAAARYLAAQGLVDPQRLAITGESAGGFTTLCALVFHDDFSAGASHFGIADLEPFAVGGTHKFESRYADSLVGPYPEAAEIYRARSPVHFADRLSCPVILLQGLQDEVVPPAQAEIMVAALEAKGLPYAYVTFEGEQHGFRKAENIQAAAEAEVSFYAQIYGFELDDPIPPVQIHNR